MNNVVRTWRPTKHPIHFDYSRSLHQDRPPALQIICRTVIKVACRRESWWRSMLCASPRADAISLPRISPLNGIAIRRLSTLRNCGADAAMTFHGGAGSWCQLQGLECAPQPGVCNPVCLILRPLRTDNRKKKVYVPWREPFPVRLVDWMPA